MHLVQRLLQFFVIYYKQIHNTSVNSMTFYYEEKNNNNPPQHPPQVKLY